LEKAHKRESKIDNCFYLTWFSPEGKTFLQLISVEFLDNESQIFN